VFTPFSIGPRKCIGWFFGVGEAKLAISTIIRKYRFEIEEGYEVGDVLGLGTYPKDGLPVRVTLR
jgi:cytochrome P450